MSESTRDRAVYESVAGDNDTLVPTMNRLVDHLERISLQEGERLRITVEIVEPNPATEPCRIPGCDGVLVDVEPTEPGERRRQQCRCGYVVSWLGPLPTRSATTTPSMAIQPKDCRP